MASFKPGQSGNPKGRPTKEEMALRNLSKSELDQALSKLRPASAKALQYMIAAMHNENIPEKDRLKYAKDVWDAYLKAIALDSQMKKAANTSGTTGANAGEEEEEGEKAPVYEFRIVS